MSDIAPLAHLALVLGQAPSGPTARRALDLAGSPAMLDRIARAWARARAHAWKLPEDTPAGIPWLAIAGKALTRWLVTRMDATLVTASSTRGAHLEWMDWRTAADEKSPADALRAARQYSGTAGGIALGQVAVTSLSGRPPAAMATSADPGSCRGRRNCSDSSWIQTHDSGYSGKECLQSEMRSSGQPAETDREETWTH
jgi:hypothetical protein